MSEQLRKYINEWNEEQARPVETSADIQWKDRELYSIQNAVRSVYEKEKDELTEEEKKVVEKILNVDLSYFV